MTHSLCHSLATKHGSADVTYSISDCVKSFCWAFCHVGALESLHWGRWPTDPMPPIKCWQRWAQNMLPFLPIASGDAMATRRKKLGPPRHSMHALASIVKRLKSSTSVFFWAEITERALMWNLPSFISSIFSLFSPCSPSLRHPLHDYGSKCEALIKPWPLCFKGLALSHNFPCVTTSESGSVRFPFQSVETSTNNHNFLETLLENFSIRSAHGKATLLHSQYKRMIVCGLN